MIDFSRLSVSQALGWPTTIVLIIGLLSIAISIGFAIRWLVMLVV